MRSIWYNTTLLKFCMHFMNILTRWWERIWKFLLKLVENCFVVSIFLVITVSKNTRSSIVYLYRTPATTTSTYTVRNITTRLHTRIQYYWHYKFVNVCTHTHWQCVGENIENGGIYDNRTSMRFRQCSLTFAHPCIRSKVSNWRVWKFMKRAIGEWNEHTNAETISDMWFIHELFQWTTSL